MGQTGYAENFVGFMLGWVRGIAASIAGLFKTGSAPQSGGAAMMSWFSKNWLVLLIVLIAIGIIVDWVVWMFRWRPYWLWFRKRRIVLNDDVDDDVSERELERLYDMDEEDEAPRFHSTALPREDEEYEDGYDEYEDEYDDFGEYDEDEEEAAVPADDGDEPDEGYEAYALDDDEIEESAPKRISRKARNHAKKLKALEPEEPDEEWDDIPSKRERRSRLFGRRAAEDEDPFAVDEKAFRDLDDDFFDVVSENPHPEADEELHMKVRTAGAQEDHSPRQSDEDGDSLPASLQARIRERRRRAE